MIYFYLNNERLKAMFAVPAGRKIIIKSFYDMEFSSEFLNDPGSANIDLQLTEAMLDMIRKNNIKSSRARFVLENTRIPYRELTLPYAKPSVLLPVISSEIFTDKKLAEAHTVDYVVVDCTDEPVDREEPDAFASAPAEQPEPEDGAKEKKPKTVKTAKLMITYIDNQIITNLKKCCRNVGMKLTGIDISQNALSKLVWFMKDDMPENFVLIDYRLTSVTSYLFVGHKHVFSLTKPIYSMPSENYASEMAFFVNDFSGILSEAVQFFRSKYEDCVFSDLYISGDTYKFPEAENELQGFMDLNIRLLPVPENIIGAELHDFNGLAPLVGTMLKAR